MNTSDVTPYVTAAVAIAAALAMVIPPPPTGANKFWVISYRLVNWVALNFGHARNATDPSNQPKV